MVDGRSWVRVRRKANIFGGSLAVEGVMVRGGRAILVFGGGAGGEDREDGGFTIVWGGLDRWLLGGNAGSLIMSE